jgi:hypothetical protein
MVCTGSTLPLSVLEKPRIFQVLMLHFSGDLIRSNAGLDNSVNYRDKRKSRGGVTLVVFRNSDARIKFNLHPNTDIVCCLK